MKILVIIVLLQTVCSVRLKEGRHLEILELSDNVQKPADVDFSEHDNALNEQVTSEQNSITNDLGFEHEFEQFRLQQQQQQEQQQQQQQQQQPTQEDVKRGIKLNPATGALENIVVEIGENLRAENCKNVFEALKVNINKYHYSLCNVCPRSLDFFYGENTIKIGLF